MSTGYSIKSDASIAKAYGKDLPISEKVSIEISNYIRGDNLDRAKRKLHDALDMKKPIPFKKYTNGVGHKRGYLISGRFPQNACNAILKLLESAESNALFKGFNSKSLYVYHIAVQQASKSWRNGRQSRRRAKKCHVEIALKEMEKNDSNSKEIKSNIKKEVKIDVKQEVKNEVKPEIKNETKKETVIVKTEKNKVDEK